MQTKLIRKVLRQDGSPFPAPPGAARNLLPANDLGRAAATLPKGVSTPMEPTSADITAPEQRGRPFQTGQSGNPAGRPKGAKNKITELFLSAMANDFAEHGMNVIERVRTEDPSGYLKTMMSLLPRELILAREQDPPIDYANLTDDQVGELLEAEWRRRRVAAALAS